MEKEGLYTELADDRNVLLVLPLGPIDKIKELKEVFIKISEQMASYQARHSQYKTTSISTSVSKLALSYREMRRLKVKPISIESAEGFIAAEAIIPYPPGIPLIAKGEQITSEHIHHYSSLKRKGARFQGAFMDNKMYVFDRT